MKKQKCTYANKCFAVLCGFMVLIPWIVHLKFWELSESMRYIFNHQDGIYLDLFLYYKEITVILAGIFVLVALVYEFVVLKRKVQEVSLFGRKNRWILICVSVFVLIVTLSAVFSADKETTLWGIPSEGEGVFALISYMLLFLGAILFMRDEKDRKAFRYALRILMVITIVLTCIEFFYAPLLEIPFFQNFLAGGEYRELIASVKNESFRNFVVLTFYNPNYFGGFCLLMIPFAIYDLVESETLKYRILHGICLAGMYFCVLTAKSTASFYLAIFEGILLLGITWIRAKEMRKGLTVKVGIFLACFAMIFGVAFLVNGERLGTVTSSAVKNERYQELGIAKYELTDIQIEKNVLRFYTKEQVLTVVSEDGTLMFYDTNNKPLTIGVTEGENGVLLELDGEEFAGVTLEITGNLFAFDFGYESLVYFRVLENNFYGMGQNGQLLTVVSLGNMQERVGTEFYGAITGRGYAWIHTLPILKETVLLGKGAGNFALHFPQYDYVGLLYTHGTHELVADKPHCMYLQVAVDHGVIALLALLGLFAGVGMCYMKLCMKHGQKDAMIGLADAAFTVLVAFTIYSTCNDSNVAVSPVFWIIFGALVSNLLYISQKKVVL